MNLGNNIATLRKYKKMTQEKLAEWHFCCSARCLCSSTGYSVTCQKPSNSMVCAMN